jgi:hypothetical protein
MLDFREKNLITLSPAPPMTARTLPQPPMRP